MKTQTVKLPAFLASARKVYVVQLPYPYADVPGQWDDRREGPFERREDAEKLAAELRGPGNLWPDVRVVERDQTRVAVSYEYLGDHHRSARNFEEFASAEKIQLETGLSIEEARAACEDFNANRSDAEIDAGTKMEFESED